MCCERVAKDREFPEGASLSGIEPAQIVAVIATVPHGDGALQLIYRTPEGEGAVAWSRRRGFHQCSDS